jgi:hypothetical protein
MVGLRTYQHPCKVVVLIWKVLEVLRIENFLTYYLRVKEARCAEVISRYDQKGNVQRKEVIQCNAALPLTFRCSLTSLRF